jgi:hypothetical protein
MEADSYELGNIHVESELPKIFFDKEIRKSAHDSLESFENDHGRELPQKYLIAKHIFDRPKDEQVCTADARDKLLAWRANDLALTKSVLSKIDDDELSVVLRSNLLGIEDDTPTLQIRKTDLDEFKHYQDDPTNTRIWREFFEKIKAMSGGTLDHSIVQVLKNIREQKGLFLVRPSFIYNPDLRTKALGFHDEVLQAGLAEPLKLDGMPESFVGFRIIPLADFAREKKKELGLVFVRNPETNVSEPRGGYTETYLDAAGSDLPIEPFGRSIDYADDSKTTQYYQRGQEQYEVTHDNKYAVEAFNEADLRYLWHVLKWQLPRIVEFEKDIEHQPWLPHLESVVHQFVVFPPEHFGDKRINTQYFDYHPYTDLDQYKEKAKNWGLDFDNLSAKDLWVKFK